MNTRNFFLILLICGLVAVGTFFGLRMSLNSNNPSETPESSNSASASEIVLSPASSEPDALASVKKAFTENHPGEEPMMTSENYGDYWKITAKIDNDISKIYLVPKETGDYQMELGQYLNYGIYFQDQKLGNYELTANEKTNFQGEEMFRWKVSGKLGEVDLEGYLLFDRELRTRYSKITSSYSGSTSISDDDNVEGTLKIPTTTIEITSNFEENEITLKETEGENEKIKEFQMPPGEVLEGPAYFELLDENLDENYSKKFGYIINNQTPTTLELSVTKEENLTVQAGKYNCWVLSGSTPVENQTQDSLKIWVSKSGKVVPKAEVTKETGGKISSIRAWKLLELGGLD